MTQYPIFYDGTKCGEFTVRREGLYLSFCAQIRLREEGVPRIYIKGETGEALLGVPQPGGGVYTLRRTIAAYSVEKLGPFICGEVRFRGAEEDGWRRLRPEEWQFCRGFCARLPGLQNGLCRRKGEELLLAFPYDESAPFPFPGLFCLAQIRQIGEGEYVVFAFDGARRPVLHEG